MKTMNPWKVTTLGLAMLGAVAVAGPDAIAAAGDSLHDALAAMQATTNEIRSRTDNLPSDPASQGQIDAAFATVGANLATLGAETATIKVDILALQGDMMTLLAETNGLHQHTMNLQDAAAQVRDDTTALRTDTAALLTDTATIMATEQQVLDAVSPLQTRLTQVMLRLQQLENVIPRMYGARGGGGTLLLDPGDGHASALPLATSSNPEHLISGHLTMGYTKPDDNRNGVQLECDGVTLYSTAVGIGATINLDFTCHRLRILVTDYGDGVEGGAVNIQSLQLAYADVPFARYISTGNVEVIY